MSRMFNPPHPGEVLQEYLPEGTSVTAAARKLGVSRQALSAILSGRAGVSAEMAGEVVQGAVHQCRPVAGHADAA